jgi:hypothetical protein
MSRCFFNLSLSCEERYEDADAAKGAAERVALELSDEGALRIPAT